MTDTAFRLHLAALLAGAAILASPPSHGQGYVGTGIGPSRIGIAPAPFYCRREPAGVIGPSWCDTEDTGRKVYGGWSIAGPWAIEFVHFDWGRAAERKAISFVASTLDTRARGLGFGGAFTHQFGEGHCHARLGVAWNVARTDTTDRMSRFEVLVETSDKHRSTEAYYGLGCGYRLTPEVALIADADFSRVRYMAGDKADARLLTFGLRFGFR